MENLSPYLFLIPLFPLLGAALNLILARRIPRLVTQVVAVAAVVASWWRWRLWSPH
jgi:hypothetical protein